MDRHALIWVGTIRHMATLPQWLPAPLLAALETQGHFEYAGLTFQRFRRFNREAGLGVAVDGVEWDAGLNALDWWELTGHLAETRQLVGDAFETWGIADWDVRFHADDK